jgi:membrane-associated phospholipid phosphatase
MPGPQSSTDPDERIGSGGDLAVATGTVPQWQAWIKWIAVASRERLQAAGVALLLGAIVALASLYAFARIADEVAEQETMQFDTAVLAVAQQHRSPVLDTTAQVLAAFGGDVLFVLLALALLVLLKQQRWGAAGGLFIATAGAQLLNNILKATFQRTRPTPLLGLVPEQAYSFPSGHAMVSAAFYLFVGYLGWRMLSGTLRWLWSAALVLLVLGIGWSRLDLGVHYPTDVVAGYFAGSLWSEAVIIATVLLSRRRQSSGDVVSSPSPGQVSRSTR